MKKYFLLFLSICAAFNISVAQQGKQVLKRAPIDTSKFILVEGGTFKMGTDKPVEVHEGPVHDVTVKSFYLAKTEVTFDDFDKFCKDVKRDTVNSGKWGRTKMAVMNICAR